MFEVHPLCLPSVFIAGENPTRFFIIYAVDGHWLGAQSPWRSLGGHEEPKENRECLSLDSSGLCSFPSEHCSCVCTTNPINSFQSYMGISSHGGPNLYFPDVTEANLGPRTHSQWSQSTDARLWWRKEQRLLQMPSKESRQPVLKTLQLSDDLQRKIFQRQGEGGVMKCVISSWRFFWMVGGEVTGSQHHSPSGSSWSGVYTLMGNIQLTSSTCWGFQYLQNSSEDMAQNIIHSPWGDSKCPWFCLMAKLLYYFLLLDCCPLFLHFLTSPIKFILWNSGKT